MFAFGVNPISFLTGEVSFTKTFPLILKTLVGVIAFEDTVTDLLIGPGLFVAYFTLISAFSPGLIGCFGHVGTVHPQDPFALEMINGAFPVFVNLNVLTPSAF